MVVNIIKKIKYQAECLLFAWIINAAIITINAIKTITMPNATHLKLPLPLFSMKNVQPHPLFLSILKKLIPFYEGGRGGGGGGGGLWKNMLSVRNMQIFSFYKIGVFAIWHVSITNQEIM